MGDKGQARKDGGAAVLFRAGQVGILGWHPLVGLLLYENPKIRGEIEATRAGVWPQQRTHHLTLMPSPTWIPMVAH